MRSLYACIGSIRQLQCAVAGRWVMCEYVYVVLALCMYIRNRQTQYTIHTYMSICISLYIRTWWSPPRGPETWQTRPSAAATPRRSCPGFRAWAFVYVVLQWAGRPTPSTAPTHIAYRMYQRTYHQMGVLLLQARVAVRGEQLAVCVDVDARPLRALENLLQVCFIFI